jgi:hypothetical protein
MSLARQRNLRLQSSRIMRNLQMRRRVSMKQKTKKKIQEQEDSVDSAEMKRDSIKS